MQQVSLLTDIARDQQFPGMSKVWIYTAERPLNSDEVALVNSELAQFTRQWTAHNAQLKAHGEVYAGQMVVLAVDESMADASGCSIDKSVHFLESLSARTGIDFFDRMRFGWVNAEGQIVFNSRDELVQLKQNGTVQPDTLMVNSLATNLSDMREKWLIPLQQSWHNRLI